jgi:glycosyltransferase involved in cell wall biosynthesis
LRAAKRLLENEEIHFLLVGDGKERVNLENLANKWSLENVTFTGAHPKSDMSEFLAASDVCLATLQDIPMFRTTYPNKVFDYMASGRPTILAIDGVIREVVDSAEAGIFVSPGDDYAMASAIMRLANDQSLAKSMGGNARNYVVKHFNRDEQAASFVELIALLASSE